MFIKSTLAKFVWQGLPDDLNSIFVEQLLLGSSSYNFAVVNIKGKEDESENGEFWGYYNILEYEPKYRRAKKIQVMLASGGTYTTDDFVLFNNFKNNGTLNSSYISYYSQMIRQINKALSQHITASQLVATIYCSTPKEETEAKKMFENYEGVKILRFSDDALYNGKKADFVQFEIQPRLAELENLKHEIERDLLARLGITSGINKTHLTTADTINNDESTDLLNAFELDLRRDFAKRYNKWRNGSLSVEIRKITRDNSINDYVEAEANGGEVCQI